MTNCALPSCQKEMLPGSVPYTLENRPGQYCSRDHAIQALKAYKKAAAAKKPNQPTTVTPHVDTCDECGATIPSDTLKWPGQNGIYCSNLCLTKAETETEGDNDVTETQTTTTTEATTPAPPIVGSSNAAPATKKAAAPAATKKAAAPAAAPATKKAAAPAATKKGATKKSTAPVAAKKAAAPAATKKAAAPAAPAARRKHVAGDDPYGIFRSGTAKALIGELLADGKWHEVTEMEEICNNLKIEPRWAIFDTKFLLKTKLGLDIEINDDRTKWRAPKPTAATAA